MSRSSGNPRYGKLLFTVWQVYLDRTTFLPEFVKQGFDCTMPVRQEIVCKSVTSDTMHYVQVTARDWQDAVTQAQNMIALRYQLMVPLDAIVYNWPQETIDELVSKPRQPIRRATTLPQANDLNRVEFQEMKDKKTEEEIVPTVQSPNSVESMILQLSGVNI